ncbi:MAG: DUF309 domain-containing protein [Candidatus Eremiobacteraeota bacterium]|nr:DUF309 domain-containing protein [Candidatus Eremiobacteraeota bacterium]
MSSSEPAPADFAAFRTCWNERRFFEAHETLEPRWIRSRDRPLQGMIQLAAAMHHLQRRNLRGAITMLQRALSRLDDGATTGHPLDLQALKAFAVWALDRLEAAGSEKTPPSQDDVAARCLAARPLI